MVRKVMRLGGSKRLLAGSDLDVLGPASDSDEDILGPAMDSDKDVLESGQPADKAKGVSYLKQDGIFSVFSVDSGVYDFSSSSVPAAK